jgi:NarL family two-component system response regulator LiaR
MASEPVRVLCVDDHAMLGEGLRARLEVEKDMEFAGHRSNGEDIVGHVRRSKADIVILDIEMPETDAFQVIDELNRRCPEVKTILLSAWVRDRYIDAAFRFRAAGYLSKADSTDEVIEGIRKVRRGELALCEKVEAKWRLLEAGRGAGTSKLNLLTDREEQILRMMAKGMSRTQIAEALHRSPMTVDNHRKSIMRKLDLRDRVELVRYAIAEGLGEINAPGDVFGDK